jgi:alpha,alpha-trehalase
MFAELFERVQSEHVFPDSKTFVDATAISEPSGILDAFRAQQEDRDFDLEKFVNRHFELPASHTDAVRASADLPVEERIEELWDVLTRAADEHVKHSSLIPLPNPYVVPGGRFREVYYWDSYFTMLGLADSGRVDLISDMVENFAYLIDEIGFIPNGNRSYYCTRSQPPFFALMVELLAKVRNDDSVLARFLPQLIREYEFWMSGAEIVNADEPAHRRVVAFGDAYLNRYWDDAAIPRQESYAEDVALAARVDRSHEALYRDVRAGAESGWDFSSRWLEDRRSLATIRTTRVIPVDLNSLMYNLESLLARICASEGRGEDADHYLQRAERRRRLLQTDFFDEDSGMFVDLALPDMMPTGTLSIAATFPLFFGIASPEQSARVAHRIHSDFLKAGGWLTTLNDTGQQWDRPNGWAPMQWITFCGLENYGFDEEARTGAGRWVEDNITIYREHGRLLEKYNVEFSGLAGTGGEYEVQDGFGWTNAVLLRLMQKLR